MRIARQHHARVRIVLGQHVGTGADRIPVERKILLGHAGLRVELVGLPRDRRKKRHRHPVQKLRVLALHGHAVGVDVDHLHTADVECAQVEPGGRAFGGCGFSGSNGLGGGALGRSLLARAGTARFTLIRARRRLAVQLPDFRLERLAVFFQPDDVISHVAKDR